MNSPRIDVEDSSEATLQLMVDQGWSDVLPGLVVAGGPEPYHTVYIGNFGGTLAVTKPMATPVPKGISFEAPRKI